MTVRFWTWEAKKMGKIMGRDGGRHGEGEELLTSRVVGILHLR